jgi:hypothetical protein
MEELEQVWSQMLARALHAARVAGRSDMADYLSLKAANDLLRAASVKWLFDSLIEIAMDASRSSPSITVERNDPHSFNFNGANIVGSVLKVRQGVRCMSAEAGWTRTPADGFMRSGGLAVARINHFGMPRANAELLLTRTGEAPLWNRLVDGRVAGIFDEEEIRRHFALFAG